MLPRERILCRLALGDDAAALPAADLEALDLSAADPRNVAMIRLGALLAFAPAQAAINRVVTEAELTGVSPDEIVRCLVSLVPVLGVARTSSVVSSLALSLGYDVDVALEVHRPSRESHAAAGRR